MHRSNTTYRYYMLSPVCMPAKSNLQNQARVHVIPACHLSASLPLTHTPYKHTLCLPEAPGRYARKTGQEENDEQQCMP